MAATAAGRCDPIDLPPLERIGAQIWRVPAARGEPDESNGGLTAQLVVVRDGARVWLVSSGPTPAFGAALACAMRRAAGRRVTDVIVTRAAPELAMGNDAFAAARLWALPDVIVAMRARCRACLERLKAHIGAAGESLALDRIRVPFAPVGKTGASAGVLGPFTWQALERAPGERVLVLRHRREPIVIAQGLLWAGDVPDLRDTRSDTMLAGLRALQSFAADARVLGEQGDPAGADAITSHLAYIEALRAAVRPHLERGDTEAAAGAALALPDYEALPGYVRLHPLNVQRVWRELEPAIFR